MQWPVSRLANWRAVLKQPFLSRPSEDTWPTQQGSPVTFIRGVKIWRGDIRPSIPISGFGLIHTGLDPMHPQWSQTLTWTIDREVIVWATEKCIRNGAWSGMEAVWIKACFADQQLNHPVCISIPSGLNNFSQLMNERFAAISSLRALWCRERHKGNFSPAGSSATQLAGSLYALLTHEWGCVIWRYSITGEYAGWKMNTIHLSNASKY